MKKTLCPAITTNEMLLKVWYWHHTSGMNGKILFHEESSGGRRKYETQPLVGVSALCSIIISATYPQRFSSGTSGEWKPRRNWKMATKTEAKMLSKATQNYSCSWLEFNVPFQHKYGYIRDDTHTHTRLQQPCLKNTFEMLQQDITCRYHLLYLQTICFFFMATLTE